MVYGDSKENLLHLLSFFGSNILSQPITFNQINLIVMKKVFLMSLLALSASIAAFAQQAETQEGGGSY